ncbi:hypothetical protein [Streptomyces smyrnaeus]
MSLLRRSMPIRDPETPDDSHHRTDYDPERGWWYPPEKTPEPSEDAQ